ncbi:MAG: hypothetical protein WBG71_12715 [Leeuwenhoekiella sp.]
MRLLKLLGNLLLIAFLTVLTQTGGLIYLITLLLIRKKKARLFRRTLFFTAAYGITTFLILPAAAKKFGKIAISENEGITAQAFYTKLCNRNYVVPALNETLQQASKDFSLKHPDIQVQYLDAAFPLFKDFPLYPHRGHDDGNRIDLAFIYQNPDGSMTNDKPSRSGYGIFAAPKPGEVNQAEICANQGKWQYDFTKYVTLGNANPELSLAEKATADLIKALLAQPKSEKLFLEPHLKSRLNLTNDKVRYHGCWAVRHDDHIHFQID